MSTRFDLDDKEWGLIEPVLPNGLRGARRVDDRRVMNGIFYVLRAGCPWRDIPERYDPYTTCYNRYNRWTKRGIWKDIFDRLAVRSKSSLHLIERFFCRMKDLRRIAQRFDKLARNYLAAVHLFSIRLWFTY